MIRKRVEQLGQVVGVLFHRDAARRIDIAERRLAEAAQVGRDHAAALGERFDLRVPHRVVEREAVDEKDGLAVAAVDVGELDGGECGVFHEACERELSRKRQVDMRDGRFDSSFASARLPAPCSLAPCFFRQRFFEQRELAVHDLHVVDFLDCLALVLHGVLDSRRRRSSSGRACRG